jgi:hypothetical protein
MLLVSVLSLQAGCTHEPITPPDITDWKRVASVEGCITFISSRGIPADISIKLMPTFESSLLVHIQDKTIEPPSCWYEQPDGGILLRAGQFCGLPQEARFRKAASGWELADFKKVYVQCDQRAR